MNLKFYVEKGASYLLYSTTDKEQDILNRRMSALGMKLSAKKNVLSWIPEDATPIQCWAGENKGMFLASIMDNIGPRNVVALVDKLDVPLYTAEQLNIAILRLVLDPEKTYKFILEPRVLSPRDIWCITTGISAAFKAIASFSMKTEIDITFKLKE